MLLLIDHNPGCSKMLEPFGRQLPIQTIVFVSAAGKLVTRTKLDHGDASATTITGKTAQWLHSGCDEHKEQKEKRAQGGVHLLKLSENAAGETGRGRATLRHDGSRPRVRNVPTGGRPATLACGAMVTAPHALAAQTGISVLASGGNAADAIIAIAASLAVLYPHMTGIGGDVFFLYYDSASGSVHAYNGSGAAAEAATLDYYKSLGHEQIPERGGPAVLTVPGTIDAWFALHERYGSQELGKILGPAIAYANEGAPAARSFVAALHRLRDVLTTDEGAYNLYLERGPVRVGDRFVNPALGAALQAIAEHGRGWFYEGEGAQAIERSCREARSPLRAQDLSAHRGFFQSPAAGSFFGLSSLTTPPNSQGLAALIAQETYEAYARRHEEIRLDDGSAARVHAGAESVRLAFADRDAWVRDPRHSGEWQELLSQAHVSALADAIDPNSTRKNELARADAGDTAYFACVDAAGNAVSFIQSLFHSFGSGMVVPDLGIPLQNRGTAFELTTGQVRSLVPATRPFHTLMPCMLVRDGRPWLVYGSMGGEGQPQTALQLATRIVVDGLDPQTAIEAPRWRYGKDAADDPERLHLEARFPAACITGLLARGHDVNVLSEWEESMGHAGAIVIDRDRGVLCGGADPRGDGAAVGI